MPAVILPTTYLHLPQLWPALGLTPHPYLPNTTRLPQPLPPTVPPPQLWAACQRVLSLSIGRGALTLSTVHPIPTEALQVEALCLSGVGYGL